MAIFDELKSIAKTLREADKIEQYQQILGIQQKLLEMQEKTTNLGGENRRLKEKLRTKGALIYENNCYWRVENDKVDGPFCSRCWDKENTLIRVHQLPDAAYIVCPECETSVKIDPNYDPERDLPKQCFNL